MNITKQKLDFLDQKVSELPTPQDYFKGCFAPSLEIPNNLLIFYRQRAENLGTEYYYHYRFVLIINLRTKGTVVLDDQSFDFSPGDALLVFPYQFHHYLEPEQKDIGWLFVTFELENPTPIAPLKNHILNLSVRSWNYLAQMLEHYLKRHEETRKGYASLLMLMGLILEELTVTGTPQSQEAAKSQPTIVDEVNRYIWDNFDKNIGLEEVAKEFSYSTSHLRFIFRKKMGISIGSYIQKIKINRARSLLINSGLNISEIAAACGYDSLFSFSRAFKKKTGLSPNAYKKKVREKI